MNYFITFRTYGTWLHGDERGSVDREHNQVGEPLLETNAALHRHRRSLMRGEAMMFDEKARECVHSAIRGVAHHRDWQIHALQVMNNHVHVVVSADSIKPEKVMADFKAWATRRLRETGHISSEALVWERHGSTRYVNSHNSLDAACNYVLNCQLDTDEPRASATG